MSNAAAKKLIADVWNDIQRMSQQERIAKIKADPRKYAMTTLMANGKSASWRFYLAGKTKGGKVVRFAYATNRNQAGNYLCWRETVTLGRTRGKRPRDYERKIKRDQFSFSDSKADVMATCRRRRDAWRELEWGPATPLSKLLEPA